ncbi:hypothetical protein Tco_1328924 [Tanacetum coccineum]
MLNDPNNQILGSSSNPNNNLGFSTQPSFYQMPYYPNFQTPFANPEELSLFNQLKMQNKFSQLQQQQQPNQPTASQPRSDQQSFHLVDETEDENEEEPIPTSKKRSRSDQQSLHIHKWTNPESTNARRNRFRVTDEEPEHFGDDALPRPPGLQRLAKSQRSCSNSTTSSGSNPMMYQEFMKEQYELDLKAKMQVIEQESEERMQLIHAQRIAGEMRVLQINTRGMDPADAVIINAQKARIRAAYQPPTN